MLMAERLEARREVVLGAPELGALLARIAQRNERLLTESPEIPGNKALLSADGGVCPEHGTALDFDPWSPRDHRCSACGRGYRGVRHDRAWARWQHLWLAERAAELAAVAAVGDRDDAAAAAARILSGYASGYLGYPNADNVLGPSRLFFSTYLESIWLTGYVAAALLLRESGRLEASLADAVSAVADEAANLIGEFDEGFSNRQTWHNAALAAVAVWFEDEELATRVVEGPSGIIAHLLRGFGDDGMWFEGENYHLFALRGELLAMGWAREAGVDFTAEPAARRPVGGGAAGPGAHCASRPHLSRPARIRATGSPWPSRCTSSSGRSVWRGWMGRPLICGHGWYALYQAPAPPAGQFDSYLHEAGRPRPTVRAPGPIFPGGRCWR